MLKRCWFMLLFYFALLMLIVALPFKLYTDGLKLITITGFLFWMGVAHYAYTKLHTANLFVKAPPVVKVHQPKQGKRCWGTWDSIGLFVMLAGIILYGFFVQAQHQGRIALNAYQARDAQERQYGSKCLPVSAPVGRKGWSFNLQLVLNEGKGRVFSTQTECEHHYKISAGKSPRR